MMFFVYLLAFVIILSIVVVVHEGGHFFAARRCGVQVEAFSIGFGKKLWSRKDKKGTEWRVCAIPLGGYVQMLGDDDAASATKTKKELTDEEKKKTFFMQPVWKRAIIIFAGPFMNYVLAFVVFWGVFSVVGDFKIPPVVGKVMEGSAAQEVGIIKGDKILEINGMKIEDFKDLKRAIVLDNYNRQIDIKIQRGEEILNLQTKPKLEGDDKLPMLGVVSDESIEPTFRKYNIFEAFNQAGLMVYEINRDTLVYLGQLISGKRGASELRGPVGIAEASGDAAQGGFLVFVLFLAQVSIGIGFVNLLPIPVLDGGHLALMLWEVIFRKPLSEKAQNVLLRIGMSLLLTLVVFTLFKDVPRVFTRMFGL